MTNSSERVSPKQLENLCQNLEFDTIFNILPEVLLNETQTNKVHKCVQKHQSPIWRDFRKSEHCDFRKFYLRN